MCSTYIIHFMAGSKIESTYETNSWFKFIKAYLFYRPKRVEWYWMSIEIREWDNEY